MAIAERSELATWISPTQLALFESMHAADRRHGLDVVASLRAAGVTSGDALLAGLLHDAGKGGPASGRAWRTPWASDYGHWIWRVAAVLPGFGPPSSGCGPMPSARPSWPRWPAVRRGRSS